ncbi:MAG TPA: tetratricopeptide repeat protein [Nitrospirota bacterium]
MSEQINEQTVPEMPVDATPADYLRAVKAKLRTNKQREAFRLLMQAVIRFQNDPVILSYYGCMQALVDKKYRSGVEACKKAIAQVKKMKTFGEELLYPVLYLNLGRAYLAAQKKSEAVEAFKQGLKFDNTHRDLLRELRAMGVRKPAPVPFLDRSNPINKYIGMLTNAPKKGQAPKRP